MAQFVVGDLKLSLKDRLRRRANRNGRGREEEVREVLREPLHESGNPSDGSGTRIAAMFAGKEEAGAVRGA